MTDYYKNKNCLVTGGSGFIGQNLTRELIKREADVTVLDNFLFGAKKDDVPPGAKIITGDVRNWSAFESLSKNKFDCVFHFAAPSSIVLFNKETGECNEITIGGFKNAAKLAKQQKARLVYPSSGSVYSGANKTPHSENARLEKSKLNNYAKAKLAIEDLHKNDPDLNAVGLRIVAGYGPGEKHKGEFASVPYLFAKAMANNEAPVIFGDGTQTRDFIFIEDVIGATLAIGQHATERVVNVGTGENTSFNVLVEKLNKLLGTSLKPEHVERPKQYLKTTLADTNIMNKYYTAEHSLNYGLKKTIQAIRADS